VRTVEWQVGWWSWRSPQGTRTVALIDHYRDGHHRHRWRPKLAASPWCQGRRCERWTRGPTMHPQERLSAALTEVIQDAKAAGHHLHDILGESERTVRRWVSDLATDGKLTTWSAKALVSLITFEHRVLNTQRILAALQPSGGPTLSLSSNARLRACQESLAELDQAQEQLAQQMEHSGRARSPREGVRSLRAAVDVYLARADVVAVLLRKLDASLAEQSRRESESEA
jgi:hypothetical protein